MARKRIERRRRDAFLSGFILGLSGPALLFRRRRTPPIGVDYCSNSRIWRAVSGYIQHGLDSEESRVKAARKTAKGGKVDCFERA
jgi:hypothetical protein